MSVTEIATVGITFNRHEDTEVVNAGDAGEFYVEIPSGEKILGGEGRVVSGGQVTSTWIDGANNRFYVGYSTVYGSGGTRTIIVQVTTVEV